MSDRNSSNSNQERAFIKGLQDPSRQQTTTSVDPYTLGHFTSNDQQMTQPEANTEENKLEYSQQPLILKSEEDQELNKKEAPILLSEN